MTLELFSFPEPPSFNDEKCTKDVTVREGENAHFICSAAGNPTPRISWKREKEDDRPISAGGGRKRAQPKAGNHKQDE